MLALIAALHLVGDPGTPPPRLPVERLCEARSRGWREDGPPNPGGRNLCIQREQSAYEGVKAIWREFDPDLQERCVAAAAPTRSYAALASCLYQLEPVQDARKARAFHY